jgi:precorrin-2 dehydrogenase/sirohydrochlorin ferrochelatase
LAATVENETQEEYDDDGWENVRMSTLALNIQMHGKRVVIVGGGTVAVRKLRVLLKAGASVLVVAPDICPEIAALNDSGIIEVRLGNYAITDIDNAFLAIAATDDAVVNEQVCIDAHDRDILVNAAGDPATGNCTFPAILQRGDLEIAVSTGGRCPSFAMDVRDYLSEHIGSEFETVMDSLAAEREKLLTNGSSSTYNSQVLRSHARRLLSELTERKEPLP